jgi:hypothetical protein
MRLHLSVCARRMLRGRLTYRIMSPNQREEHIARNRERYFKRKADQGYIDDMLILNKEGLLCLPKISTLSDPA